MRTKFFIAIIAIVALSAGAFFILTKNTCVKTPSNVNTLNKLVGKWKIDSAYNTNDSNKLEVLIPYLLKDSTVFVFAEDSSLQILSPNEKEVNQYYVISDSLFTKTNNNITAQQIAFTNDNSFKLCNKDSTITLFSKVGNK